MVRLFVVYYGKFVHRGAISREWAEDDRLCSIVREIAVIVAIAHNVEPAIAAIFMFERKDGEELSAKTRRVDYCEVVDVTIAAVAEAIWHFKFNFCTALNSTRNIGHETNFHPIKVSAIPWEIGDQQGQLVDVEVADELPVGRYAEGIADSVAKLEVDFQIVRTVRGTIASVRHQVEDVAKTATAVRSLEVNAFATIRVIIDTDFYHVKTTSVSREIRDDHRQPGKRE